ncbi:dihydrofolate reductase family protein [Paracoccus sp. MBLB3053]|uniref:Dihydrofolate reductase family protein n=1 Tax=Paracoccus aurantius TaxID=3073814 RepID=A0ABU2HR06_9RHOB|nr:dihydrofolate reductase family protein [Paracoccus sp. MBLB3053]MDS9467478.1 dihydrofolate reductase family protein [Paracoccus sp. MBLB3053]
MQKPEIICHMVTSLDGRIVAERWPFSGPALVDLYESVAERLGSDGWIVGRRTMEDHLPVGEPQLAPVAGARIDRMMKPGGRSLGICFDRQGRLRPETGEIDGDHLVLVVSEQVSEAHVAQLSAQGVSVVFSGPHGDDISGALSRIAAGFGAKQLLLEGGGQINGAFLGANLIDQTSTLILPVLDGQRGIPVIYDHERETKPVSLELLSTEILDGGIVWLRHRVARN